MGLGCRGLPVSAMLCMVDPLHIDDHAAEVGVRVALSDDEAGFAAHLAAQSLVDLASLGACKCEVKLT